MGTWSTCFSRFSKHFFQLLLVIVKHLLDFQKLLKKETWPCETVLWSCTTQSIAYFLLVYYTKRQVILGSHYKTFLVIYHHLKSQVSISALANYFMRRTRSSIRLNNAFRSNASFLIF